ncbi:PQQ-binding-like beta-propeller repeat protein [Pontibacter toksunensis]|uniref:PQQ-binding-like beta-propeller repeat protein n=1 Tax=Pontibacter toksunensis TaxID=1332631 RepID=A0ABW6BUK5_9BACT
MPCFRQLFPYFFIIICLVRCIPSLAQNVTEEWVRLHDGEGPGDEYFQASAIDAEGNIYLTSTSFTAPAYSFGSLQNHGEILTVKYSPSGEVLWASRFVEESGRSISQFSDEARAIVLDGLGGVYVTGVRQTETAPFIIKQDIILFKLNVENGEKIWDSEFAEGDEDKEVHAVTIDESANLYLTGTSIASSTLQNYLTLKYNGMNGDLLWDRQYDGVGKGNDKASAIAVDKEGGVVVTGKSFREVISFPGHGPSYQVYDIATIRYDADNGEELWSAAYTGDTLVDVGGSLQFQPINTFLAIDDEGDVYVAAKYRSMFGTGGVSAGVVTMKYNSENGNQVWESRYNSNSATDPSIALDGSGGVYVAGHFGLSNAQRTFYTIKYESASGEGLWEETFTGVTGNFLSAPQVHVGNADDVYLTSISDSVGIDNGIATLRINSMNGSLIWNKFYRASLTSLRPFRSLTSTPHIALLVDESGIPYVMGSAYTTDNRINSNLFIVSYSVERGAVLWNEQYEATGHLHDFVRASAVDAAGNIYVAGISTGFGIGNDIRVVKYSNSGEELWVRTYDGGVHDRLEAIALDGAGGVYLAGTSGLAVRSDFLTLKLNASDGAVV